MEKKYLFLQKLSLILFSIPFLCTILSLSDETYAVGLAGTINTTGWHTSLPTLVGTKLYQPNMDSIVTVIDTVTNTISKTIEIWGQPQSAPLASPTLVGTKLYQPSGSSNSVVVIDTITDTVITTISVGVSPLASPTLVGTKLYQPNAQSNDVSVIDTITDTVITTISVGVSPLASPTLVGTKLYQPNTHSSTVSVIDTITDTVINTVDAGNPYFSPVLVGTKLYQPNNMRDSTDTMFGYSSYSITVIDTITDTVLSIIPIPLGLSKSPTVAGTKLYQSNYWNSIVVIDTMTDSVISTISVGAGATPPTLIGDTLYQPTSLGAIGIIDMNTDTMNLAINNGGAGKIIKAGNSLYQASEGSNTVSIIDLNNWAPTVTPNSPGSVVLQQGDNYEELGATWSDDIDGVGSDFVGNIGNPGSFGSTGTIDTNTLGEYTLTYIKTDSSGLTGSAMRTISVIPRDTTIPTVTLSGSNHIFINQKTELIPDTSSGITEKLIPHVPIIADVVMDDKTRFYPIEEFRSGISYTLPFDFSYYGVTYASRSTINIYPEVGMICMASCLGEGYFGPYFGILASVATLAERGIDVAGEKEGIYIVENSGSVLFRWKVTGSVWNQENGSMDYYPLDYEIIITNKSSIQMNYGRILGNTWAGIAHDDTDLGPVLIDSQHQYTDRYNETTSSLWSYSLMVPKYQDEGASWTDDRDGSGETLTGTIFDSGSFVQTGSVDLMTPGDYLITYTKIDNNGNIGTKTRIVTVLGPSIPTTPSTGTGETPGSTGSTQPPNKPPESNSGSIGTGTQTVIVSTGTSMMNGNQSIIGPGGFDGSTGSIQGTLKNQLLLMQVHEKSSSHSGMIQASSTNGGSKKIPKTNKKNQKVTRNIVTQPVIDTSILKSQIGIQSNMTAFALSNLKVESGALFSAPVFRYTTNSLTGSTLSGDSVSNDTQLFHLIAPKTDFICPTIEKVINESSLLVADISDNEIGDAIKALMMFRATGGNGSFKNYTDQGTANNQIKFLPHNSITRAEFIKLLVRSLACQYSFEGVNSGFSDVQKDDWSAEYITYAVHHGWVKGYSSKIFEPNKPITRAEASKILANAIKVDIHISSGPKTSYRDISPQNEFAPYINGLHQLGILSSSIVFRPNSSISRAETATLFYKTFFGGK